MKFDRQLLEEMIRQNYVMRQKHPDHELYIYNYTQTAQYNRVWNACTLACRGLILDDKRQVIARPFPKFFNLEEPENATLPDESFKVYEKLDGSLGILYWINDRPYIASRGSFTSEQAQTATHLLHTKYSDTIDLLDRNFTYLFEIIYPDNRIVVDYGDTSQLVMLGKIHTESGVEAALTSIGFPVVRQYDGLSDLARLRAMNTQNKEGFVIRFENGHRLKIKFEEYKRLHTIVTMVSTVTIWEYLKDNIPQDELLNSLPDELFAWVKARTRQLNEEYNEILAVAKKEYKILNSRKETALYFKTCTYPSILFNLLDGKPVDQTIWKLIKPAYEKPFSK
ncbi:MAG: T4 RnlA family RNA ligase [Cyclobacteriaceae bacterium]